MATSAPIGVHAHRCEACAANGKNVVWIHPDTCAGKVQLHKCPECGEVQWKKFLVEPGALPQLVNHAPNTGVSFETLLGYILVAVVISAVCYGAFLYVKKIRGKQSEVEIIGE